MEASRNVPALRRGHSLRLSSCHFQLFLLFPAVVIRYTHEAAYLSLRFVIEKFGRIPPSLGSKHCLTESMPRIPSHRDDDQFRTAVGGRKARIAYPSDHKVLNNSCPYARVIILWPFFPFEGGPRWLNYSSTLSQINFPMHSFWEFVYF